MEPTTQREWRHYSRRPGTIHPPPKVELLTTSEAGHALGYSTRSITAYISAGLLPSTKTPGGRHRIPRVAVVGEALRMGLKWATVEVMSEEVAS